MRILIAIFGFAALTLSGQNSFLAEGRLIDGTEGGLSVEVSEGSGKIRLAAAPVHSDSSFQIELPADQRSVEFRVLNRHGDVIEVIQQWPHRGAPIELRLTKTRAVPTAGGAISLKRLSFQPSSKSRREFANSRKLHAAGKKADSMAVLHDIVNAEPAWFDAWLELGTLQAAAGDHRAAADSFRRAHAIDPNAAEVYPLLGLALIRSGEFQEGGQIAQKGLDIKPDCTRTKYVLGLAMAAARQTSLRAIALLEEVQWHFPEAMVPLAALLLREGQFEASRDTAWRYLHMAKAPRTELASSIWREASFHLTPHER